MTTISDARLEGLQRALVVDGGHTSDLEQQWLIAQIEAATGEPHVGDMQLNGLWAVYLGLQGIEPGALPDMKAAHFEAVTGVSAARPDQELLFWQTL